MFAPPVVPGLEPPGVVGPLEGLVEPLADVDVAVEVVEVVVLPVELLLVLDGGDRLVPVEPTSATAPEAVAAVLHRRKADLLLGFSDQKQKQNPNRGKLFEGERERKGKKKEEEEEKERPKK